MVMVGWRGIQVQVFSLLLSHYITTVIDLVFIPSPCTEAENKLECGAEAMVSDRTKA